MSIAQNILQTTTYKISLSLYLIDHSVEHTANNYLKDLSKFVSKWA